MRLAALGLILLLVGCATPAPPPAPRPLPPPPPSAPIYVPPVPQPPRDQCGAGKLQTLVGQPRTEIPVPIYPGTRRVTCTTCPVTMDFQPGRLNILFDQETGIVREVKCG